MAAASDKARFFLEQSVPELTEYERKKIFSPEEITSITKKRSDFEHKINARGSTPSDYARYAEFEINVEALRKKRVKRLGVKATNHNGQRRIFFVFDRGTKKLPGDVGLWMQSIEYARRQKAYKKLTQIFTNVLRLHPSRPELWIYAAQFAIEENGDMTEARGYMQRGLRFCKNKKDMWLQYARLEMSYTAKIYARRQILGISEEDEVTTAASEIDGAALSIALSQRPSDADGQANDDDFAKKMEQNPALSAAVPIAIFDAAMLQFGSDPELAHAFVEVMADYSALPTSRQALRHIRDYLLSGQQTHWATKACDIREPVFGISAASAEFPTAFRESLKKLKAARAKREDPVALVEWSRGWLESLLKEEYLDPAIQTVIEATSRSLNQDEPQERG